MAHTRKWWWLGVIALAVAGINYSLSVEGRVDKQQARQTGRVDFSNLTETVIATGVIRPMVGAEVNVGSRISGTVVKLPVEVGDRVEELQFEQKDGTVFVRFINDNPKPVEVFAMSIDL